jgi:xanthine dehydrogenase small subunit
MAIEFQLNGKAITLADVDPHQTLLHWLRAQGLTGTKEGCAEGECGACAVAWVRHTPSLELTSATASTSTVGYVPVNSCLIPLGELTGTSVLTVEYLAHDGHLHPVQSAMVERGGSQCGYCTPGFVMSLFCEYYRPGRNTYDAEAIGGNLCRCTGYRPIVEVAKHLPEPNPSDPFLIALNDAPRPQAGTVDARFHQPDSLQAVFELQARIPDAVLLGGGTDLMVAANQRYQRYPALISLDRVSELKQLRSTSSEVAIGACVPLASLESWLLPNAPDLPALHQLLPLFSSRLIRNRATLGGNLATASPIGDAAPVLLALDATFDLASASGTRRINAQHFFQGYRKTQLAKGEIIHTVHIPRPAAKLQRFYKVSKRVLDDIATVSATFALDLDSAGSVAHLRLAYGGVAATPVRALAVENAALGQTWDDRLLQHLRTLLRAEGTPMNDHRGSADYRRAMMGKLFEQFFYEMHNGQVAAQ